MSKDLVKVESIPKKKKIPSEILKLIVGIVALALVMALVYAGTTSLSDAADQKIATIEAEKELEQKLVAEELNLPAKNILFIGYDYSGVGEIKKFQTDNGLYLVKFKDNAIESIVKKRE